MKLINELAKKDVQKYFYSLRVVDEWNQANENMITAGCIKNLRCCMIVDNIYEMGGPLAVNLLTHPIQCTQLIAHTHALT